MAKRYHDTEIWKQDWYIELPHEYRELWHWIKDTCDHAGIWKPNKALFERLLGEKVNLKKALSYYNKGKKRIRVLPNGRWFLEDFISFQYLSRADYLNPHNRLHLSIINILLNNEVNLSSIRGLKDLTQGVKDKDKDKVIRFLKENNININNRSKAEIERTKEYLDTLK